MARLVVRAVRNLLVWGLGVVGPLSVCAQPPTGASNFDLAETIAQVGNEPILRGEVLADVNILLAPALKKMSPDELQKNRAAIDAQRDQMVQQLLGNAIERKLMYMEFIRTIPSDKLEEAQAKIQEQIGTQFQEALFKVLRELDKLKPEEYAESPLARQEPQLFRLGLVMKEYDLTSVGGLDALLRQYGTSLRGQQRAYAESQLGRHHLQGAIERKPEVTFLEKKTYYDQNLPEFQVPLRAKWEQITIRFDRCASKFEAGEKIATLANQAFFGAAFGPLAKRHSHGPNADEGGFHDWTAWADLEVSREINQVVFSIPVGKLSDIIIDAEGLHIVRVLDRHDQHIVPFTEAQIEIEDKLQAAKRREQIVEFVDKLKERTPVWTIYDDDQAVSESAERVTPGTAAPPRR